MKTKYRHIYFQRSQLPEEWDLYSRKGNQLLGRIAYYAPWEEYVFTADSNFCVFSAGCLKHIIHFMGQLKEEK